MQAQMQAPEKVSERGRIRIVVSRDCAADTRACIIFSSLRFSSKPFDSSVQRSARSCSLRPAQRRRAAAATRCPEGVWFLWDTSPLRARLSG